MSRNLELPQTIIKPNKKKRLTWYNLRLLYQVVISGEMSSCIYVYDIPKIKNGTTTDNIYLEV